MRRARPAPPPLVDHGPLWSVPWTVLDAGQDEDRGWLRLGVDVVGCPVSVTRNVAVDASGLRLDYTLTNHGTGDLPVLWAGHGLLAAPPGRVRRPADSGSPPGG